MIANVQAAFASNPPLLTRSLHARGVAVAVGVLEGAAVAVGVGDGLGVAVSVLVGVGVADDAMGVGDGVGVQVGVGINVAVSVLVGVAVASEHVWTLTSSTYSHVRAPVLMSSLYTSKYSTTL